MMRMSVSSVVPAPATASYRRSAKNRDWFTAHFTANTNTLVLMDITVLLAYKPTSHISLPPTSAYEYNFLQEPTDKPLISHI
jgi:hypothetical protein